MHIAFVDSNPAALDAIRCAKEAGHRVSFVQSSDPLYPLTEENLRIVRSVDWLADGQATTDAACVTDVLAKCHADTPIDVVITQHEMAAEAVAIAARTLGLRGTNADAVLTARRKDRCRTVLRDAGLQSARFAVAVCVDEALAAADAIGYPVVMKPPSGGDSLLSFVARDSAQARAACSAILAGQGGVPPLWRSQFTRGVLIEERLRGELVSVEIGARDGEFYPFCISGRFRWREDEVVELGSYIPADLSVEQAAECVEYAMAVCRAVGLDLGIFHLEIMLTSRGPILVEANPRIMGGALPTIYRHATGRNIYTALLQILTGAPVDAHPGTISGCTAGRKVMVRSHGQLPEQAELDWLDEHSDALIDFDHFHNYKARPGQPVRPGEVIARFFLRGRDRVSVARRSEEILRRTEQSLGLELMIENCDSALD
jgi:biotin carboxylase